MTLRLRTIFLILLGIIMLWFLYLERAILSPFILAAIFAYIFNPVVNFFSHKIKLPRTVAILIIYAFLMSIVVFLTVVLTRRAFEESSDFSSYVDNFVGAARNQLSLLPDFVRPTVYDTLSSLERSKLFAPQSIFTLFPEAISRVVSFLLFLFSAFYFLKEGRNMIDRFLLLFPEGYKIEAEILLRKINAVLNSYLRGQILMVVLVSSVLYIALSILGVRFALILAIFSGFAEIIPIIGPIVATSVAAIIAFVTGTANYHVTYFAGAMMVVAVYVLVRQFQDYFISPYVMGKITKLHPLVVLFAVIAGEHIGGIMGLVLAVPVAATIRILLEFSMDQINQRVRDKTVEVA